MFIIPLVYTKYRAVAFISGGEMPDWAPLTYIDLREKYR